MNASHWNRRAFLKASLAGTFLMLSGPPLSEAREVEPLPEGRLRLYNTHTDEKLDIFYREPSGAYDPGALDALDYLLRCHYTQKATRMDLRVIEFLNTLDKNLGGENEIHVISGYRSPEYNERLIREGHEVAKHSLHLSGRAIDVRIPGMGLEKVRKAALSLRYGGVGYYPESGFVHLDSGRFRFW